uniref:Uncharacterized protein n=1 Tax=Ditylenchus dipsaci TaxID=166011 RepID=A0A915DDA0_9BILA
MRNAQQEWASADELQARLEVLNQLALIETEEQQQLPLHRAPFNHSGVSEDSDYTSDVSFPIQHHQHQPNSSVHQWDSHLHPNTHHLKRRTQHQTTIATANGDIVTATDQEYYLHTKQADQASVPVGLANISFEAGPAVDEDSPDQPHYYVEEEEEAQQAAGSSSIYEWPDVEHPDATDLQHQRPHRRRRRKHTREETGSYGYNEDVYGHQGSISSHNHNLMMHHQSSSQQPSPEEEECLNYSSPEEPAPHYPFQSANTSQPLDATHLHLRQYSMRRRKWELMTIIYLPTRTMTTLTPNPTAILPTIRCTTSTITTMNRRKVGQQDN